MKVKQTLTNNSPTILAALGVSGFIAAIFMTAKAAPRAAKVLEEGHNDSTTIDKLKAVAPIYAPTAGMVLVSTACIVGSNRVHSYRYASLLALYSIGQQTLDRWQDAVLDTVGKKKYEQVRERVVESPEGPLPASLLVDDERVLFYDVFTGRYFRGDSIEIVRKVANDITDRMFSEDFASLNDYYYGIGLDRTEFGDDWGWNIADGAMTVEFDAFIRNERPVVSVTFNLQPRKY